MWTQMRSLKRKAVICLFRLYINTTLYINCMCMDLFILHAELQNELYKMLGYVHFLPPVLPFEFVARSQPSVCWQTRVTLQTAFFIGPPVYLICFYQLPVISFLPQS